MQEGVFVGAEMAADLLKTFPEYTLILLDDEDCAIGASQTIPVAWDGTVAGLPTGWTGAIRNGFHLRKQGGTATALCALGLTVDPQHRGRGLSSILLRAMRRLADKGLTKLIVPVRPTLKSHYPLIPMHRYVQWRTVEGEALDPWIRTHEQLGARGLGVAARSMTVVGTVDQWEDWSGMAFPETGKYVVPGALAPVQIDRDKDVGRYVEANFWMLHP